jgi:hypothetical protein
MARIDMLDDSENWLKFGGLVLKWICKPKSRPTNVAELKAQLEEEDIIAGVPFHDKKPIEIYEYDHDQNDDAKPIRIPIPSAGMLLNKLHAIGILPGDLPTPLPDPEDYLDPSNYEAHKGYRPRPYPLPQFYDAIYSKAPSKRLPWPEALNFALRRIGEYTINECC